MVNYKFLITGRTPLNLCFISIYINLYQYIGFLFICDIYM